jgi:hypothetical protein
MNIPIISFGNGEVTQKLDCRLDTQKFSSSCRSLKNMLPLVYGCAERRTGTKFVLSTAGTSESYSFGTYGSGKYGE